MTSTFIHHRVIAWLTLLLICLAGGYFPVLPEFAQTVALMIAAVLLLMLDPAPLRHWLPSALTLLLWVAVLMTPPLFRLLPLTLVLLVMRAEQPDQKLRQQQRALVTTAFLAALISPLFHTAQLRWFWQPVETVLNRLLSLLLPGVYDVSASIVAFPLLLLFVIWWLNGSGARRGLRTITGVLTVTIIYLVALVVYLATMPETARGITPWFPFVLFLILALLCTPVYQGQSQGEEKGSGKYNLLLLAPLLGAAALIWFNWTPHAIDIRDVRIAVREEGDWARISTRFGEEHGPRLGALLDLARNFGATVDILPDSALVDLSGYDLLFLFHPVTRLDSSLVNHWYEFLHSGGGVLVVGDHTNIKNIQTGVNSFLEAGSHLRLRFDSAISTGLKVNWADNQLYLTGPGSRALYNSPDFGISIGASVEAKPPAFPLIEGIYAFSDHGDPATAATGGMGNSHYDRDERFGNIELVAAERIGAGKLVLIGDTSGMMSLSIPHSWRWHLELIDRLAGDSRHWGFSPVWFSWLLMLLGGVAAWKAGDRRQRQVLLLLLWLFFWQGFNMTEPRILPPAQPENICWIDKSHNPNWDMASRYNWSAAKLHELLYENNLQPLHLHDLDAALIDGSRFLLLNGPTSFFRQRERRELQQFLQDGNHLILAADARRTAALAGLQRELGFGVLDIPLGTASVAVSEGDTLDWHFYEAWPVTCEEKCDTLISAWEYPLALRRQVGQGIFTLIGDHRFFCKQSLEGEERKGGQALAVGSRYRNKSSPAPVTRQRPARSAWEQQHSEQLIQRIGSSARPLAQNYNAKQEAALWLLGLRGVRQ